MDLRGPVPETPSAEGPAAGTAAAALECPVCGSPMVLRTARRGATTGTWPMSPPGPGPRKNHYSDHQQATPCGGSRSERSKIPSRTTRPAR